MKKKKILSTNKYSVSHFLNRKLLANEIAILISSLFNPSSSNEIAKKKSKLTYNSFEEAQSVQICQSN